MDPRAVAASVMRASGDSAAAEDSIVLGVRADPEPDQIGAILDRQRAIVQANADSPKAPNLLQSQRRVTRVLPEQFVTTVGQASNLDRELPVAVPEPWVGSMVHKSVQRPSNRS